MSSSKDWGYDNLEDTEEYRLRTLYLKGRKAFVKQQEEARAIKFYLENKGTYS